MNLNDIAKEAKRLKEKLLPVGQTMEKLDNLLVQYNIARSKTGAFTINNPIVGSSHIATDNAQKVKDESTSQINCFLQGVKEVSFLESTYILGSMQFGYSRFGINKFIESYLSNCKIINDFIAFKGTMQSEPLVNTIKAIQTIVEEYNKLIYGIDKIIETNNFLNPNSITKNGMKIRFLKEDKSISRLIKNITLVQNIYDTINKIIKEDEELKYRRIESGTLELNLDGCVQSLVIMAPLLTAAYKVYSEQFSPKARLERKKLSLECKALEEKTKANEHKTLKVKVRGDYIKVIQEVCPDKKINFSDTEISNNLLELEIKIKEMCSENPCIKINDEKIGRDELKDTELPIKLLDEISNKDSDNSQEEKTDK